MIPAPNPIKPDSTHKDRDWDCDMLTCKVVTNDLRSFTEIDGQFFCAKCVKLLEKELLS
jgi:hypothetical protein